MKKGILRLALFCSLLAVSLGALLGPVAARAASGATVSISPATQQVNPGESFSVEVVVDASVFMRDAQFTLSYDTKYLECVSVTLEGNAFQEWAAASSAEAPLWYPKPNATKTPGSITYGIVLTGPPAEGPEGGVLLECQFKAKTGVNGTTALTLSDVVVGSPVNEGQLKSMPIEDLTVSNAQVTVGAASATRTTSAATTKPKTTATTSHPPTTTSAKTQTAAAPPTTTASTTTEPQPLEGTTTAAPATVTVTSLPATGGGATTQSVPWAIVGGVVGAVLLAGIGGFAILNKKK